MGNQQGVTPLKYEQILLSGKLGDGGIVTQVKNSYIVFNTINEDYLIYKQNRLKEAGFEVSTIKRYGKSGYKKDKVIPSVSTKVDARITDVKDLSVSEAIGYLDKTGFIQLYLDDGSYKANKKVAHLYINSFSEEEVVAMVDKIEELYGHKRCSIYRDKKKDGRSFPYLYIPTVTMAAMIGDIQKFLIDNKLYSLYYKGGLPSTTIETT